jgi:hypothetical protein
VLGQVRTEVGGNHGQRRMSLRHGQPHWHALESIPCAAAPVRVCRNAPGSLHVFRCQDSGPALQRCRFIVCKGSPNLRWVRLMEG